MRRGPRAVPSGTLTFEDKMKENREQPKRNNENWNTATREAKEENVPGRREHFALSKSDDTEKKYSGFTNTELVTTSNFQKKWFTTCIYF